MQVTVHYIMKFEIFKIFFVFLFDPSIVMIKTLIFLFRTHTFVLILIFGSKNAVFLKAALRHDKFK